MESVRSTSRMVTAQYRPRNGAEPRPIHAFEDGAGRTRASCSTFIVDAVPVSSRQSSRIRHEPSPFFLCGQTENDMSHGWLEVFAREKFHILYSGPVLLTIQPDTLLYKCCSKHICSYRIAKDTLMIKFEVRDRRERKCQTIFVRFLTKYDFESAATYLSVPCIRYLSADL